MFPDAYFAPRYFAPRYWPRQQQGGAGGTFPYARLRRPRPQPQPDDDEEVLALLVAARRGTRSWQR